jgi:hypothetical protein
VIASTIGTTIEWYDFFLYGTAAGLVFGWALLLVTVAVIIPLRVTRGIGCE